MSTKVLEPWRLFAEVGPVQPDGSCAAIVSNYHFQPLSVAIDFPSDALTGAAAATASWTYKGKTHPLPAEIVPPSRAGVVTVRVTVPKGRAALVNLYRPNGT